MQIRFAVFENISAKQKYLALILIYGLSPDIGVLSSLLHLMLSLFLNDAVDVIIENSHYIAIEI
ncbi:hypothetical protein T10_1834 [Trichinella papuae]|uniref:Uncharacterized protein n=1 Tax=Trichinella papuae TaxID=268474 RepID=A0A0V1MXP8_9BILA|nr:hypothetical protein T10_1834 [Trichinella papuae]